MGGYAGVRTSNNCRSTRSRSRRSVRPGRPVSADPLRERGVVGDFIITLHDRLSPIFDPLGDVLEGLE